MASTFKFLIETMDRQTLTFCGQCNADGQGCCIHFFPVSVFASFSFAVPIGSDAQDGLRQLGTQVSVLDFNAHCLQFACQCSGLI